MPSPFRPGNRPARIEQRRSYDKARDAGQPCRRWYKTARWQRLRAAQLAKHPICTMCEAQGRIVSATVCDHVEPHRGCELRFWSGPFQSLCEPCHSREKQREEAGRAAR